MDKNNLTSVLRVLSLINICISGILLYRLERIPSMPAKEVSAGAMSVRKYILKDSHYEESIPHFSPSLQSLFPQQTVSSPVRIKISEDKNESFEIPHLIFIGMVDTGANVLYSFKNTVTNKLLFLEKGVNVNGLTLLECQDTVCTIKTGNKIFQVVKE